MVFVSVWLNFLPLPISIGYLWLKSKSLIKDINHDIEELMQELM